MQLARGRRRARRKKARHNRLSRRMSGDPVGPSPVDIPGVNDVTNVAVTGLLCLRWQSVDSRVIKGCGGRPQQPLARRGHCSLYLHEQRKEHTA